MSFFNSRSNKWFIWLNFYMWNRIEAIGFHSLENKDNNGNKCKVVTKPFSFLNNFDGQPVFVIKNKREKNLMIILVNYINKK